MKKIIGLWLLIAIIFSSASIAQQKTDAAQPARATPEERIAELEKRVTFLEAQLILLTSRTPATTQPQIAGTEQADAKKSPLILDDWDFTSAEGDFGQSYYEITLRIRNAGTKRIKLIDASVEFRDLLDQSLYGIKISPDVSIEPGKTNSEKGRYSINQFIAREERMRRMKKADIKATLVVRRIVFDDNSVLIISD